MLPPIKGFTAGTPHAKRKGEIACRMEADDTESIMNITAIVSLLTSERQSIDMSCEQVAEILQNYVMLNRCSQCGHGSFMRKISVYESRDRIADMLHCLGCGNSYRIGSDLSCEGLDPSAAVRLSMLEGMRQFKSLADVVGSGGYYFEGAACSGAR